MVDFSYTRGFLNSSGFLWQTPSRLPGWSYYTVAKQRFTAYFSIRHFFTIEFDSVSFSYPSRPDSQVLKYFSLTVSPGETVAIVGHSGKCVCACRILCSICLLKGSRKFRTGLKPLLFFLASFPRIGEDVESVASKDGVLTTGELVEGNPPADGALGEFSSGNLSSLRSVVGVAAFTTGVVSSSSSLFETTKVGCGSPPTGGTVVVVGSC